MDIYMPRQRIHKPELITYGPFTECSVNSQLLIILLQNFCDDNGNHPAHLKSIKARVFPSHDFTLDEIGSFVKELLDHGLLIEYEAENSSFYHIAGWEIEGHPLYQQINKRKVSIYPAYQSEPEEESMEESTCDESLEIKKQRKVQDTPTRQIFNHWVEVMQENRHTLTPKIDRIIKAQLKIFSIEQIFSAIDGCIHDDFLMGRSEKSDGRKFNTLDYIFREKHFQRLIGYAEFPPVARIPLSKDDERKIKNNRDSAEFLEEMTMGKEYGNQ